MMPRLRLWLLTNTPSPYQVEFFSAIHRSGRLELDVRFMDLNHRGEVWRPDGGQPFQYQAFRAVRVLGRRRAAEYGLHPGAIREVLAGRHDFYLLSGHYTSPTFLLCALTLWMTRKRWGVWLERPWPDEYRPAWANRASARRPLTRWARNRLLRRLVRMAPGVVCIGSAAKEAYQRLGAAPEKTFVLPYVCDTTRYEAVDSEAAAEFRRRRGWDGKFVYLFSGQFIERKGVDLLVAAFARLARDRSDAILALLGDGPLRAGLLAGQEPEIRRRVESPGHVAQADLPVWFAAADAFVFPSRHDGWGVVVNEACAAGLPVVTMDSVGAAHDLVIDGHNGFVLPRDDADGLYHRMRWLAEHREEARQFGRRSRELVARFSLDRGVELLAAAVAGGERRAKSEERRAET